MALPKIQTAPTPRILQPTQKQPDLADFSALLAGEQFHLGRDGQAGSRASTETRASDVRTRRPGVVDSDDSRLQTVTFAFSGLGLLGFAGAGREQSPTLLSAQGSRQAQASSAYASALSLRGLVVSAPGTPDAAPTARVEAGLDVSANRNELSFDAKGDAATAACALPSQRFVDEEPDLGAVKPKRQQPAVSVPQPRPMNRANVVVSGEKDALVIVARAPADTDGLTLRTLFSQIASLFGGRISELVVNGIRSPIGGLRGRNTR